LRVGAQRRVARNDHELAGERARDLIYDALQDGKPQREEDGIGALQRVAVVDGDNRSWRAMTDPIPPVPMIAVVMAEPPVSTCRRR
jgi:hypothetical protein